MPKMLVKQVVTKELDVPNLGERVREERRKSVKTLEKLCRESGFSRTYWYDIENELLKNGLPIENLRKIEAVLGVDFGVVIK